MKRIFTFSLALMFVFIIQGNSVKACLHFTESFTSPYIPQTYTTGSVTLSSGVWDIIQVRGDLAANAYGATGGAARLAKNITAEMISPAVNSIKTISFYYRTLNTGSGTFKVQKSINDGAFTDIATLAFSSQTYALFSITINDASGNIRIKILSDNNTENLIVDEVTIDSYDISPPTVFANAQTVSNTGQTIQVQSNEADGYVYIIKEGVAQSTLIEMDLAVTNLQGAKTVVTAANTDMNISALNLETGNYFAYAVDCWENISVKGTNIIQVISSSAIILGLEFGDGNYKIASVIPVTITAGGTGYTAGTITINGRAATDFTDNGNNTYSVVYAVQEGDADAAQASDVPISVILLNGASPSAAFTGPAIGTITIDANKPLITASQRTSDTEIKLTANELLAAASITQLNDGGFIISDLNNSGIQYAVTAVNPGISNSEIILTVDNFGASSLSGLTIIYAYGGNGFILDAAGNNMATNFNIPEIAPWNGTEVADQTDAFSNSLKIYPNPATDLSTCSISSSDETSVTIEITNYLWQRVYSEGKSIGNGNNTFKLDVSQYQSGIYFVTVRSANGKIMESKQLVIQ